MRLLRRSTGLAPMVMPCLLYDNDFRESEAGAMSVPVFFVAKILSGTHHLAALVKICFEHLKILLPLISISRALLHATLGPGQWSCD